MRRLGNQSKETSQADVRRGAAACMLQRHAVGRIAVAVGIAASMSIAAGCAAPGASGPANGPGPAAAESAAPAAATAVAPDSFPTPRPFPTARVEPTPTSGPLGPSVHQFDGDGLVHVLDNGFFPPTVRVAVGSHVTWENRGEYAHDIQVNELRNSGFLGSGNRFSMQFPEPGEFTYWCNYHSEMYGRVVVYAVE